jgi:hypothetical protein
MTTALPPIGFGGSPYRAGGRRVDLGVAARVALDAGYRLFDLAELYGTESAFGRAFRAPPRRRAASSRSWARSGGRTSGPRRCAPRAKRRSSASAPIASISTFCTPPKRGLMRDRSATRR